MIWLSYDTSTQRHPFIGMSAEQVPTFGPARDPARGRFVQKNVIFRDAEGELAQADAVLHQDAQGTELGDKFVVASQVFRVAGVELKTDPLFGHSHERVFLQRWSG